MNLEKSKACCKENVHKNEKALQNLAFYSPDDSSSSSSESPIEDMPSSNKADRDRGTELLLL